MCSAQHHRPSLKLIWHLRSPLALYAKDTRQPLGRNLIGIQYRLDRTHYPIHAECHQVRNMVDEIHSAGTLLAAV